MRRQKWRRKRQENRCEYAEGARWGRVTLGRNLELGSWFLGACHTAAAELFAYLDVEERSQECKGEALRERAVLELRVIRTPAREIWRRR
ncbi:hypothetical protein FA13DRAFT_320982 [Coprinellus micaceus]|uniref:Uncharacterized protein n=1 Tax=Coprinellus micaceus TaxID=71717 RepID=A0A4Y7TDC9_COPMI|nr:hypothetical protein FA13DRAFT_319627 [Coprinellus micaceus]TEB32026.1 hypothetical protein FA13DRAFT_320982 [Coprinellus micaceus]